MYRIVFCIIPHGDGLKFAEETIKFFASKIDAPLFIPHLTYYTHIYKDIDEAINTFHNSLPAEKNITLNPKAIEFSELYTKSIYLSFHPNQKLTIAYERVQYLINSNGTYKLNPHLSLTYTNIEQSQKAELVKAYIKLPDFSFDFNKFLAIHTPLQAQSKKDIEKWKIIAEA